MSEGGSYIKIKSEGGGLYKTTRVRGSYKTIKSEGGHLVRSINSINSGVAGNQVRRSGRRRKIVWGVEVTSPSTRSPGAYTRNTPDVCT